MDETLMDTKIMSKEKAEAYREEFRKATAKWGGEVFQHFATEEARQQHLEQVKEAQEQHKTPF